MEIESRGAGVYIGGLAWPRGKRLNRNRFGYDHFCDGRFVEHLTDTDSGVLEGDDRWGPPVGEREERKGEKGCGMGRSAR